jgi:hypothetical protein
VSGAGIGTRALPTVERIAFATSAVEIREVEGVSAGGGVTGCVDCGGAVEPDDAPHAAVEANAIRQTARPSAIRTARLLGVATMRAIPR